MRAEHGAHDVASSDHHRVRASSALPAGYYGRNQRDHTAGGTCIGGCQARSIGRNGKHRCEDSRLTSTPCREPVRCRCTCASPVTPCQRDPQASGCDASSPRIGHGAPASMTVRQRWGSRSSPTAKMGQCEACGLPGGCAVRSAHLTLRWSGREAPITDQEARARCCLALGIRRKLKYVTHDQPRRRLSTHPGAGIGGLAQQQQWLKPDDPADPVTDP